MFAAASVSNLNENYIALRYMSNCTLILIEYGILLFMEVLEMAANEIHVVPESETNNWKVERTTDNQPVSRFTTKEEAIAVGRQIAQKENLELVAHDTHGRIQEKDSHGNDPFPPRG
jgi:hypothetical protein